MLLRQIPRNLVFALTIVCIVGNAFAQRERESLKKQPEKRTNDQPALRRPAPRTVERSQQPEKSVVLKIAAGKSLRYTLPGTSFNDVTSVIAVQGSKKTNEVSATLGSPGRSGRLMSIQASPKASGEYQFLGVKRNRSTVTLPVQLAVIAAVAEPRPDPARQPRPRPTVPRRPDPAPEPSQTVAVKVQAGESAQAIVSGDIYGQLRGVWVLHNGRTTRDVAASLSKTSRGWLLSVKAAANAETDGNYTLAGRDRSGDVVRLPVNLTLVAASSNARPVLRPDDRPERRPADPVADRRPGFDPSQEANEDFLPALTKMMPAEQRTYPFSDPRYDGVTAAQVMSGGQVSNALRATIEGSGGQRQLRLETASNAPAADYHVVGLVGGRPQMRLVVVRIPSASAPNDNQTAPTRRPPRDTSRPRFPTITLRRGRTQVHTLAPQDASNIDSVRVLKGNQLTGDIDAVLGAGNFGGVVKMIAGDDADPGSPYQLHGMKNGQAVARLAMIRVVEGGSTGTPPGDVGTRPSDPGDNNTDPGDDSGGIDLGDVGSDPDYGVSDPDDLFAESPVRLVLSSQQYSVHAGSQNIQVQIQRNGYNGSMYLVCFRNDFPLLPFGQASQVVASIQPPPDPDNGSPYSSNVATTRINVAPTTPVGEVRQFRVEGFTTTGERMTIPPTEFSVQVAASSDPAPTDPGNTDPGTGPGDTPGQDTPPADTGVVQVAGTSDVLSPGISNLSGGQVGAFYDANGDGLIASVQNASNNHVYPRHAVASNQSSQGFTLQAGRAFHPGSDVLVEAHLNWSTVNRPQFAVLYLKRQGNSLTPVQMWAGDLHNAAALPGTDSTVQGVVMNSANGQINLTIENFQMPGGGSSGQLKGVGTANVFFTSPGGAIYGDTVSFAFDCPILSD